METSLIEEPKLPQNDKPILKLVESVPSSLSFTSSSNFPTISHQLPTSTDVYYNSFKEVEIQMNLEYETLFYPKK